MTRFDVMMGKNIEKKESNKLILLLEEEDDVLKSIKQGLIENKIKKAKIFSVEGILKEGIINSTEEGKKEIQDAELIKASGNFQISVDDLWGSINIFTGTKKPLSGQLLQGKAKEGLKIVLEY
jgi:predicted DNA-binding protein with PD1-like motif